MKAISLHQPFASLVARGIKTIETRTWATNHRGDLLICSTKVPRDKRLPLGQALAVVDVIGCREFLKADEVRACCDWYKGYAWLLTNIRPIDPFPVTGRQGFFDVDFEY